MLSVDGYDFIINVKTPLGKGKVVGWGQEEGWDSVAAGEVVVELEDKTTSFDPHEIDLINTTLVLA